MSIVDEFGNDIRKMLQFAWGQQAASVYPSSAMANMSKSETSSLDEVVGEGLAMLHGLTKLEKRGQASQIRGMMQRVLIPCELDVIITKLEVDVKEKWLEVANVAKSIHAMKSDHCSLEYIEAVVLKWGGEQVNIDQLMQLSGKSERQERRLRKGIEDLLWVMFDDVVETIALRLTT